MVQNRLCPTWKPASLCFWGLGQVPAQHSAAFPGIQLSWGHLFAGEPEILTVGQVPAMDPAEFPGRSSMGRSFSNFQQLSQELEVIVTEKKGASSLADPVLRATARLSQLSPLFRDMGSWVCQRVEISCDTNPWHGNLRGDAACAAGCHKKGKMDAIPPLRCYLENVLHNSGRVISSWDTNCD